MALSVFAYSLVWGWRYAAGFVALIFVHEMGHYLAARQRGLNVGAPVFIPFVGAWIALKDKPMNAETEAYIGYAGPLVGTLGALACYFYARYTGEQLFLALAYAASSSTCSTSSLCRHSTAGASPPSCRRASGLLGCRY